MANKVIIAGSRTIPEYNNILFNKVSKILQNIIYDEIVSGACKGADKFGEWFACQCSIPIKRFPADWSLGKKAGYLRNKQMAEYSTHLIAIWDGKSKGTKNMIDLAKEYKLKIRIILWQN